jgi:hypothetical protein
MSGVTDRAELGNAKGSETFEKHSLSPDFFVRLKF